MIRRIYHGSSRIIKQPVFGTGNQHNDYGLGFYCTEQLELALEWAVDWDRNGFANAYDIETEGLDILNLNDGTHDELQWLAILLENRTFDTASALASEAREYILQHFLPNYRNRDIIVGYRADDSYFAFAQDFISGGISYRRLCRAMRLGKLGEQVVVVSQAAFSRLVYVESVPADSTRWLESKTSRDQAARHEYLDTERHRRQKGDLFVQQIIDEEMIPGDPRLR